MGKVNGLNGYLYDSAIRMGSKNKLQPSFSNFCWAFDARIKLIYVISQINFFLIEPSHANHNPVARARSAAMLKSPLFVALTCILG
jgi:hypothetical protein